MPVSGVAAFVADFAYPTADRINRKLDYLLVSMLPNTAHFSTDRISAGTNCNHIRDLSISEVLQPASIRKSRYICFMDVQTLKTIGILYSLGRVFHFAQLLRLFDVLASLCCGK